MTTMTDPPQGTFRLSMLLYDTRYRSATIQAIALIGFMLGAAWLINNVRINLALAGIPFQFSFLWESADYDINQKLIEYNSQSTHFRASLVGLLNTLLVAVMGCLLATVLGVSIGILRLSPNWIVSRLAAVYVEMFRNVPLLLWISLVVVIMHALAQPKTFRGEDAESSMLFFDSMAITNQGVFVPRMVFASYSWVLLLAIILSVLGIKYLRSRAETIQGKTGTRPKTFLPSLGVAVLPVVIAYFAISTITSQNQQAYIGVGVENAQTLEGFVQAISETKGKLKYCHASNSAASLSGLQNLDTGDIALSRRNYFNSSAAQDALVNGKCYIMAVSASEADQILAELKPKLRSGTPISVLPAEFMEGRAFEVDIPVLTPKGIARFEGGTHIRPSLLALWLALSLYTASFIAEIVRAGIMAISKGQTEAAEALGIQPGKTMSLVILPQAMRVIIPPLISQYLNLTKNSSLAVVAGYMDITQTLGGVTMNQTGREMETIMLLMLCYLTISLTISTVMNIYNERTKLRER